MAHPEAARKNPAAALGAWRNFPFRISPFTALRTTAQE